MNEYTFYKWKITFIVATVLIGGIILLVIFSPHQTENSLLKETEKVSNYQKITYLNWNHMPLTYSFSNYDNSKCSDLEKGRIKNAFDIIENDTNERVNFTETDNFDSSDIKLFCYNTIKNSNDYNEKMLTAGEASYTAGGIMGDIITGGFINFYSSYEDCKVPNTELHEILHLLGYSHINDYKSIMAPIQRICLDNIDESIITDLINNYS